MMNSTGASRSKRENYSRSLAEKRRRRARESLLAFTRHTFPAYAPGRFHAVLCGYLDRVASGKIKRLMIFAPPQHGKSELVSRRFPAKALGQDPDLRVIAASYAYSLAASINRDVKRVIDGEAYAELFPGTRLYGKNVRSSADGTYLRNSDEFEIVNHKGGYRSAGVGMGIVGKPASGLLIDDPVAGAEQAYSPTYREKLWDWYNTEASTRLQPTGWTVLMHQRWHEDDLAGRLLKRAAADPRADQWCVVRFPARAYPRGSPLRCPEDWRDEGDPLWPERFGADFLDAKRASMSPQQWAALYQQHPVPLEGAHFRADWFGTWRDTGGAWLLAGSRLVRQADCRVYMICDPAASSKQSADHTALMVCALTPVNDLVVLEVVRGRWPLERIVPEIAAAFGRWPAACGVCIEACGFAEAIALEAARTPGLPPVRRLTPRGQDKLVRATDAINRAAARQVYLPESAPWVPAFVDECVRFTGRPGDEDDQVDCLAYAALLQTRGIDGRRAGGGQLPRVVGN